MRWLLAASIVLICAVVLALGWLASTEAGLRWLAASAVTIMHGQLRLEGVQGTLAGTIGLPGLRYEDESLRLEGRGIVLRLELGSMLRGQLHIASLHADALKAERTGGEDARGSPASLLLGVRIDEARIANFQWEEQPLADLHLHNAGISRAGVIRAEASVALPHPRYPGKLELRLSGDLGRPDIVLSGTVAGIPLSADARLARDREWRIDALEASAGPLDLSQIEPGWPHTQLVAGVSGATGSEPLTGKLALRNAVPGALDAHRLPLAALQANFSTDFRSLLLRDLAVALSPAGRLSGSARLDADGLRFEGSAAGIDLRAFHTQLRQTHLQGPLRFKAETAEQSLEGTLAQDDMAVTADLVLQDGVVDVRSLRATAAGGEATGKARIHLGAPLHVAAALKLSTFNPARFGEYPEGSLSGELEAHGSLSSTGIELRWTIDNSTLRGAPLTSRGSARVSRERVTRAQAQATLGSAQLDIQGSFGAPGDALALKLEVKELTELVVGVSGRGSVRGRLEGTWTDPRGSFDLQASRVHLPNGIELRAIKAKADGTLGQHDVHIGLQAEGTDLTAALRGGWKSGQGWKGSVQELRNPAPYPLALSAPVPLAFTKDRVELGPLHARLGKEGSLRLDEFSWSAAQQLVSKGDVKRLPAHWLLLALGLEDELQGSLLLDAEWNLAAAPRLSGTLAVRRASGDLALSKGGPIALGLENAMLDIRFNDGLAEGRGEIASRFGSLELAGSLKPDVAATGLGITKHSPLSLRAHMNFTDVGVLAAPTATEMRLEGRLQATVEIAGTLDAPALAGSVRGEAIALQVPPYGIYLGNGRLQASLAPEGLRLTEFSIQGGKGSLTANGLLPLGHRSAAQLEWRADNLTLLQRPDLLLVVSGSGLAELVDKRVTLTGKVRADHGNLELAQERLPQLGDDVVIAGEPRPAAQERARVPLALDVQLDLGDALRVRGYGLEGRLGGELRVRTTKDGELRAFGRIEAVHATFFAYGQSLEVDPGVAVFDGPIDNPSLQLTAWRRNQQVEVGVQISGSARAPRVQLVSQPPVPEGERISWLVLGRPPGEATKADLGLLQAAAGALLARGDDLPLDRRIARALGLDEISLRGSGEAADRVVAVGKRLSDRLYVSYEQGIGAAVSALVKLDLALTDRFSVRAQTGTASGIGLFYRFSWD